MLKDLCPDVLYVCSCTHNDLPARLLSGKDFDTGHGGSIVLWVVSGSFWMRCQAESTESELDFEDDSSIVESDGGDWYQDENGNWVWWDGVCYVDDFIWPSDDEARPDYDSHALDNDFPDAQVEHIVHVPLGLKNPKAGPAVQAIKTSAHVETYGQVDNFEQLSTGSAEASPPIMSSVECQDLG